MYQWKDLVRSTDLNVPSKSGVKTQVSLGLVVMVEFGTRCMLLDDPRTDRSANGHVCVFQAVLVNPWSAC